MINILSYVGMTLQSEVCLWTLLGLVRTIFDATLFKVNANLKQVWQMRMPGELTLPVQRVLRTIISGVMLVQCFTVYVYLASYIVLLYPVFLEERPALVLPWLLLAAIRKLLCELTSLALGLGTCVLLGPARPPCIKFVIIKVASIMPAFYMWILVYSYYHSLKVASAFKTFPAVLPDSNNDYGLELAIRRRRTKSLLGEDQLRKKLVTNFYNERRSSNETTNQLNYELTDITSHTDESINCPIKEITGHYDILQPISITSNRLMPDVGCYEDWFGSEVTVPRDGDRVLEQFGIMMLRIGVFLNKEEDPSSSRPFNSESFMAIPQTNDIDCTNMPADDTETPLLVGSTSKKTASYLQEYPQIFMKKHSEKLLSISEDKSCAKRTYSQSKKIENGNKAKSHKRMLTTESDKITTTDDEKVLSRKKRNVSKTSNEKQIQDKPSEKSVVFEHKKPSHKSKHREVKQEILKQSLDEDKLTSVASLQTIMNTMNNEMPTDTNSSLNKPEEMADGATSSRHITETFRNEHSRASSLSQNENSSSIEESSSTGKILKE